ncbi:ADP-ribosylglycohydrolase family protein, partial [Amycolatopsis sp. NPDC000740]
GGDSDTIGCMAAAIAGAYRGIEAIDEAAVAEVERANDLDLAALADELLAATRH